mmetsp:Transcript_31800/g.99780  ORF Transcript_31800/g.99780 Transcript_31800/m.99780 type:complete len:225 (-) Transcript_31800:1042-1716(-)
MAATCPTPRRFSLRLQCARTPRCSAGSRLCRSNLPRRQCSRRFRRLPSHRHQSPAARSAWVWIGLGGRSARSRLGGGSRCGGCSPPPWHGPAGSRWRASRRWRPWRESQRSRRPCTPGFSLPAATTPPRPAARVKASALPLPPSWCCAVLWSAAVSATTRCWACPSSTSPCPGCSARYLATSRGALSVLRRSHCHCRVGRQTRRSRVPHQKLQRRYPRLHCSTV